MLPRHARISTFDDTNPSKALEKMYKGLSRPQCSVLTQLRTGHIGVNAYLHRFKLAPSPLCPYCDVPESVPHFLLGCPTHRVACLHLIICVKPARLSLTLLQEGHRPGSRIRAPRAASQDTMGNTPFLSFLLPYLSLSFLFYLALTSDTKRS
ncbi:hypothetical protein DFH08DRAFT_843669 [Mycena albidolilacea]|uniref:Reverse transcriptase zinc-binding domain-containing protein n=1 Tax=Mycena albidolilacea TaxID=1033008 RepID=A0AAD7F2F5_9AGAR|nr:hypothetical protein DFH08DRAFT_843669 [Mycena albidolilacea]